MSTEGWKSTDEAAAHVGMSRNTFLKFVALGVIPGYRPARNLRFKVSDLDAFLESRRVRPQDVVHLLPEQVRDELRRLLAEGEGELVPGEVRDELRRLLAPGGDEEDDGCIDGEGCPGSSAEVDDEDCPDLRNMDIDLDNIDLDQIDPVIKATTGPADVAST
jgi:excisionase family DNA binding protein